MFQNDNEIAIKQNRRKPKRAGTNKESTSISSQHQERKEEVLLEQEYIDSIIDYDPDFPEEVIENVDFSNYNDSF